MKSILVGLVMLSWIHSSECYSQTDTTYCLPIGKARKLVTAALRLQIVDSLHNVLSERIDLLQTVRKKEHDSFTNLLKISEEKYQTQKENTGHMERLALSYKSQMEYYIKREKKQRRKKNLLGIGLAGVVILTLIK